MTVNELGVFTPFCVNQGNAATTLKHLKSESTSLRSLLDSLKVGGLELEHFLLEPVQRLARYALLISQVRQIEISFICIDVVY
jgi:hypothetical protein